ncbi:MAG: ABC transporter ATP-binding protein [Solirubrobacteraceae bacterium]
MSASELRRRLHQTADRGRKLRGLIEILAPYRWRVLAMLVSLLVATGSALAPAPLAKLAIDDGINRHDFGALDLIVGGFVLSAVLYALASAVQTYLVGWVGQRALQDLRVRLFAHLQTLSIGFYSSNRAGVIISRLTNDVEALDQLVSDGVATLVQSGLTLIGVVVILLVLDAHLALLTFLALPLLAAGALAFRIASADAYRLTREKIAAITGYLQESLSGIRVVRMFGQEARHIARFGELNDENCAANMTTVRLNAAYFPAVELLSALVTVEILAIGGIEVIDGHTSTGVVFGFIAALNNFFDPIQQLSQLYTTYQSAMAALDKIFGLLDEQPELSDAPGALSLGPIHGELRFEDVSFHYGARRAYDASDGPPGAPEGGVGSGADGGVGSGADGGVGSGADRPSLGSSDSAWALRDVDLLVPAGQTVALVGATGAGKSTLAKLIARLYDPTEGRVLVDGHDLRSVSAHSLRSQMGYVPQEGFLFSGTVRENIAFGRPAASDEEIHDAARSVGAHEFIAALQHGYDTEVGERGVQLSAGQRQLIAFARALVADPRILVLDEATSNVDVHTEGLIEQGLRRLLAGRTAIVIAHRLSTIRHAARIVVLEHGIVVEQGTHEELLQAEGRYWRLYRDWAEQATAA